MAQCHKLSAEFKLTFLPIVLDIEPVFGGGSNSFSK